MNVTDGLVQLSSQQKVSIYTITCQELYGYILSHQVCGDVGVVRCEEEGVKPGVYSVLLGPSVMSHISPYLIPLAW